MTASEKPYRRGVGIVLLNNDGQVFVAQRIDTKEPAWQMPQGGIDKGEDPLTAAVRELKEETGITNATLIAETNDWLRYDLPPDLQTKMWKGKYLGQEQKWYLMRFTGTDDEINLDTKHPEFSEWKWTDLRTIPELIVEFKRDLYWQIVDAFADHVRPAS
ncbi:MAG: RNA pyrophosphohydrolase [Alphaproteobacteria bacterium]|nr:RNA pyrophosphohydrolase [Alphaproteobacteria bacterium]